MKSHRVLRIAAFGLALLACAAPAYAAGSGMPWEGPLEQIVDSITGPVARAAAVIAIVIAGVTIIFSEGGGFIFNAIHNVQAGTPVENIVAMIDAVHEFNGQRMAA